MMEIWIVEWAYSAPDLSWEIYAAFTNEEAAIECRDHITSDEDYLARYSQETLTERFKP